MMNTAVKTLAVTTAALTLFTAVVPVSFGESVIKKPVVKQAAVGAAAGVALGALSDRATVGKSAATGAVVGAGTGLMTQSKYLKDKPLLRNTLQGAAVGTGVSYATGKSKVEGAAIGAGSGAGYRLLKNYIDKK